MIISYISWNFWLAPTKNNKCCFFRPRPLDPLLPAPAKFFRPISAFMVSVSIYNLGSPYKVLQKNSCILWFRGLTVFVNLKYPLRCELDSKKTVRFVFFHPRNLVRKNLYPSDFFKSSSQLDEYGKHVLWIFKYPLWCLDDVSYQITKNLLRLKIGSKVTFSPKSLLTFYCCKIEGF